MGLMQGPKPDKDKGKKTSTPFNKSGIFAGGSTGSGAYKYVKPERKMSATEKRDYLRKAASSDIFRGGVSGSGTVKSQWVGEGKDRKYVNVAKANEDKRAPAAEYTSGGSPRSGRDGKSSGDSDKKSVDETTVRYRKGDPVPGSLKYFMEVAGSTGRGSQGYNRAYGLWNRQRKMDRARGTATPTNRI